MSGYEDEARLRLLIHHVGKEIELRGRLLALEHEFRTTTSAHRKRQLTKRLSECRAELSDNDMQLTWLRGGSGDHTTH